MAENVTGNRGRRYIRIASEELWQLIDEIAKDEKYDKSFNLIVNDALYYGLPILLEKLHESSEEAEDAPHEYIHEPTREGTVSEELLKQLLRVMKEVALSESINKSLLSSIFNACQISLGGEVVPHQKFAAGDMANTPGYLEIYELRGLKKIRSETK